MITLHIYNDLQMATLARMRLESEGIEGYIHSSGIIGILGIPNALGGVRLQVPEHDMVKAAEIINEFNKEIGIED